MAMKSPLIIIHRVNTVLELMSVPRRYGVEIDVRGHGGKLLLTHDPISCEKIYTELEDYLREFDHAFIIFNMKEAGHEDIIVKLAERYNIKNYFLLDVEFPYLYRATRNDGFRKIAVRYSEAEPIEFVEAQMKNGRPLLDWVWIDTNTTLPLDDEIIQRLSPFKTCLVCPDRWGRPEDIDKYIEEIDYLGFELDAVMTSLKFAERWEEFNERKNVMSNYYSDIPLMVDLIKEAARMEILPLWKKCMGKNKTTHDFVDIVTDADKRASNYILERIEKKFPGSYSEEDKRADRFENDIIWQIDPLDGTQEFCEHIEEGYACHAALLKKINGFYEPVAGIIYLPGTDTLWYSDGKKVVFERKGIKLKIPEKDRSKIRGYVRKVDPNGEVIDFYHDIGDKLGMRVEVIHSGGAGASISDLLEGKINLIVMNYDYTKEWDLAMAEPIIKAIGGFICDLDGNDFVYNRKDVPGLGEPYNLKGYIISTVFSKEEILPHITEKLLISRLKKDN